MNILFIRDKCHTNFALIFLFLILQKNKTDVNLKRFQTKLFQFFFDQTTDLIANDTH